MKRSMLGGILIVVSTSAKFVASFSLRPAMRSSSSSTSSLPANFLDSLQKSFSTAAAGTSPSKYYTIGITGAGGLVGTALQDELRRKETLNGKPIRIVQWVRGTELQLDDTPLGDLPTATRFWNSYAPSNAMFPRAAVAEMDAMIHLAGENVATGLGPLGILGLRPWTPEKKQQILDSRTGPTTALAETMAACRRPQTLLSASGIGVYGDDFTDHERPAVDERMDTRSTPGFLAQVSRAWEAATAPLLQSPRHRLINMRFGVVLSTKGGALGKLYPIFFFGGGGLVGTGQQYFSFISARDLARAMVHALETPSLQGPVNFCAPQPCTNAEFTRALGRALSRPTILPLPAAAVSLLFGEMGEEMLLGGVRAVPTLLTKSGFRFLHPTIEDAIQSALEETTI
jgi:uncharacterized protein